MFKSRIQTPMPREKLTIACVSFVSFNCTQNSIYIVRATVNIHATMYTCGHTYTFINSYIRHFMLHTTFRICDPHNWAFFWEILSQNEQNFSRHFIAFIFHHSGSLYRPNSFLPTRCHCESHILLLKITNILARDVNFVFFFLFT